jgi:hypothetical protein
MDSALFWTPNMNLGAMHDEPAFPGFESVNASV